MTDIRNMATLFTMFFLLFPVALVSAQTDCVLKKDKEGIRVYACHKESEKFKSIRAEVILPAMTPSDLVEFLLDISSYTSWQYNMTEAKVLKKISAHEIIYRTVVDAPWPVSSRELIVHLKATQEGGDNWSIKVHSTQYDYPVDDDLVRVPYSDASWRISASKDGNVKVLYTLSVDPGGSIPVWLVNMAIAEGPYKSFTSLKAGIARRKNAGK